MAAEKSIRALIIEGRLEKAVRELLDQIDNDPILTAHPDDEVLHDRAVSILSRLNEQKHEEGLGIDDDKERNRIRLALIDLDRDVEAARRGERLTAAPFAVKQDQSPKSKTSPLVYGLLGALLVAVLAFVWLGKSDDEPDDPAIDPEQSTEISDQNPENSIDDSGGSDENNTTTRIRNFPIVPLRSASGSLTSNGSGADQTPIFGDNNQNKEIRAYLSFPLNRLPKNARILKAKIFISRGGGDYREMDKAIIEEVNIEGELDQSDYDADQSPIAVILSDSLMANNQVEIDVTEQLELVSLLEGRDFFTIRLRPDEIIANRIPDQYKVRSGQGHTRMEVEVSLD
ncbi:MAG: hypothetical protein AAF741_06735 [Bacteroidota bacterium]